MYHELLCAKLYEKFWEFSSKYDRYKFYLFKDTGGIEYIWKF